jgi:hypothetical protein
LRTKTLRIPFPTEIGAKCSASLPASSVVKELRPWVPPRAFRARRNVRKHFEPKIKNPASSAGPIRLQTSTSGFARSSTRDYPVFVKSLTSSPRGLDEKTSSPGNRVAGPTKYSSFFESVKRRLQFCQTEAVGNPKLVEILAQPQSRALPKLQFAYQVWVPKAREGFKKMRLK